MTAQAVFSGDYTDLRFVKGRKIAQVVIEIPIEAASAFVAAFGTPNPATSVPVAIARLDPTNAATAPTTPAAEPVKERRRFNTLPLPQQVAMRCQEKAFEDFLIEDGVWMLSGEKVADTVRSLCGVSTRAEILPGTEAARKWNALQDRYLAWCQVSA